ncbi:MAG TPA: hypothetical protein VF263_18105 [Longimicrobiaceae bacterium]
MKRTWLAGALALTCAGCSAEPGEPEWRGTMHRDGAAVEVRNPAAPVFGEGAASAEPLWTTSGPTGDAVARSWSQPNRVALGAGEIYVLDPTAHRVHVVSRSGDPLRQVGREGKGPGELESPFGVAFVDGLLAVGDARSVDLFSPAGEPSGSVRLGTIPLSLAGLEPGGLLVKTFRGEPRLYSVGGGAPPVSLPGFRKEGRAAEFACSRISGAGSEIVQLDCARPVFQVISREGAVVRTVRIDREPVEATSAELDLYRRSLGSDAAQAGSRSGGARSLIEGLVKSASPKRVMRGIRYDTAAHLYAVWEQQPQEFGNGPARLHLFSREGVFLVTLPFAEPWVDFAMDARTVYALAEDPGTGVVRLAAYRVTLSPAAARAAAATVESGSS